EDEDYDFHDYYQKRKPTFLEKLRRFKQGFYNWFRNYARTQLKNRARHSFNQRFRPDSGEDPSMRTPLNQADYAQLPLLNKERVVSSWREKLPPITAEEQQYDRRPVSLGKQGPGVYVIEAVNGDLHAYGVAVVSDLVLVEKTAHDGQLLVYAANRQSGAPRANVNVEIVKGKDQLTKGTTDNQGLLRLKLEDKTKEAATAKDEGDGGDAATNDEENGAEQQ